jgi:hypothetical protein
MAKAASALADKVEDEAMHGQLVLGDMLVERTQEIMAEQRRKLAEAGASLGLAGEMITE